MSDHGLMEVLSHNNRLWKITAITAAFQHLLAREAAQAHMPHEVTVIKGR